ncbi:UNVERIFIED_CONTAM: serhl [Trichonephila clavipes]
MISICQRVRDFLASANRVFPVSKFVRNMSKWSHPQEICIPNSYGYIAAKAWGSEHHEPILALHGWQDNAGTFDKLIPLLTQDLYIVAIDAPGHGLSSHKPPGAFYHNAEMLLEIKRIVDYLNWDKFSIIGHSLGGQMGILYSSIFPESVKNVILLDIMKPTSYKISELALSSKRNIEALYEYEKKMLNKPPVYTQEEAHNRLMAGLFNQVTSEGADILLKRGCQPSKCGKGVIFSRDIKVQGMMSPSYSHEDLKGILKNLQCNLCIILGNNTPKVFRTRSPEVIDEFLDLYKTTCKFFKLVKIDGNHFVHLNNPELVAPLIDDFFQHCNSSKSKM